MHDIAERSARGSAHAVRKFDFTDCEFRDDSDGRLTFEGVASVVDTPYQVRDAFGEFTETIKKGAFNKTLRDGSADVALFVNHDTRALPLATRLDGSLKLTADPDLRVHATLNPLRPSVQEVRHAVTDGQARQMSIGFNVPEARDHWSDDYSEREVSELNLGETSIVWRGCSPTTSGSIRSYDDLIVAVTEGDLSEDEIRRAVTHLESLLPPTEEEREEITATGLDVSLLRDFWDKRIPA